jgi:hypothetical protein
VVASTPDDPGEPAVVVDELVDVDRGTVVVVVEVVVVEVVVAVVDVVDDPPRETDVEVVTPVGTRGPATVVVVDRVPSVVEVRTEVVELDFTVVVVVDVEVVVEVVVVVVDVDDVVVDVSAGGGGAIPVVVAA